MKMKTECIRSYGLSLTISIAAGSLTNVAAGQCDDPVYEYHGASAGDSLGRAVSGAGDVDGDGHADFIIAAIGDDTNGTNTGSVSVYSGATGGILHAWYGDAEAADDAFGWSVSGAGDVNGDGFDDVIVGDWAADLNGQNSGSVYVYSGADGALLYLWHGAIENDWFGDSVSRAGDVNGDGFDDVVVGAVEVSNSGPGSAYVFSGATGDILYLWQGDSALDRFGVSVSGAGDVNRDGFDDVIVGAATNLASGSAYVFSGATGNILHTWHGDIRNERFGRSVSEAGDVDGDDVVDFIIGAPTGSSIGAGSAYVFSGATGARLYTWHGNASEDFFGWTVSGAGDLDGDGFDDLIVGADGSDTNGLNAGSAYAYSGATGALLRAWHGDSEGDGFGFPVSGVGDVNVDGFPEIIIGAHLDDANGDDSGSAFVFALNCGPKLEVLGDCPGSMRFDITNVAPNAKVALLYARGQGSVVVPPNLHCGGTVLGLDRTVKLAAILRADADGVARFISKVPAGACGSVYLQAIDVSSCKTTNVVDL